MRINATLDITFPFCSYLAAREQYKNIREITYGRTYVFDRGLGVSWAAYGNLSVDFGGLRTSSLNFKVPFVDMVVRGSYPQQCRRVGVHH